MRTTSDPAGQPIQHAQSKSPGLLPLMIGSLLCGSLYGSLALADNEKPSHCQLAPGNDGSAPWIEVEKLTSDTPVGAVLARKYWRPGFTYSTRETPPGLMDERHELAHAARWPNTVADRLGTVPTNVPGIGLRVKYRPIDDAGSEQIVSGIGLTTSYVMLDVIKTTLGPIRAFTLTYVHELVLTVPPEQLPSGPLTVTGISGRSFDIATFAMPQGRFRIGQRIIAQELEDPSAWPPSIYPPKWTPVNCRRLDTFPSQWWSARPARIQRPACRVKTPADRVIHLGRHSTQSMPTLDSTTPARPFKLELTDCMATARPRVSFMDRAPPRPPSSPAIANDILRLEGDALDPVRIGVGIVVYKEPTQARPDRERIRFDGITTYEFDRHGDTATLPLSGSYIRLHPGGIHPGRAAGTAEFTLTFP